MSSCKTICHYCNKNHSCRNCPIESKMAPLWKKVIGMYMEHFTANEIKCPRCNKNSMRLLGTHAPSLDIICDNCNTNFEVKSKCLSANTIPNDLILNHGNYFDYLYRQSTGLDFIIIIYGVDRKSKVINIRQVLYLPNEVIITKKNVHILKKNDSSLSEIFINNVKKISQFKLDEEYCYDFSKNLDYLYSKFKII